MSEPAPSDRFCSRCGAPWPEGPVTTTRRCGGCGAVTYRNPAVGVAVVVVREGRILLGRRARGRYAGLWCIPCGYVEWGEDVRAAARREMLEETALEVELTGVAAVHSNFHDPERLTVGIWFHGTVTAGEPVAGDDLDALDYFSLEALPPLAFPTDAMVLREMRTRATRGG